MIFTHKPSTSYYVLDRNQKLTSTSEGDNSLKPNARLLVITDTDGKPQTVVTDSGANYLKCIRENKEIYVLDKDIVFGKKIRVYSKPNVVLLEKPELNSKVIGNLEFNTPVILVSELKPNYDPNGYIRVTSNQTVGWAERKNFTDGDYNAEFYEKSLKEIVSNLDFEWQGYISTANETDLLEIKWKGSDTQSLTCQFKEKECTGSLDLNSDGVHFSFSFPNDVYPGFECKTVNLLDSIDAKEKNTVTATLECTEIGNTN